MTTPAKDSTLENVFPSGVLCPQRWGMQVNGLEKDVIPNGILVGSAVSSFNKNRIFHIVDCNQERVKLGVFESFPGDESPCYALILDRAPLGTRQADEMFDTYEQKIRGGQFHALPKDVQPTLQNANRFIEQISSVPSQSLVI